MRRFGAGKAHRDAAAARFDEVPGGLRTPHRGKSASRWRSGYKSIFF